MPDRTQAVRSLWPSTSLPFQMLEEYVPSLVSVIVPSYNRARFIGRCLESVISQSYRPIELLVIDDGSTDKTEEVVRGVKAKADAEAVELVYFRQNNRGAPSARNQGLMQSCGEFIQYLDSDDILHPRKLEVHVAALEKWPKCDYVWSKHDEFDAERAYPQFEDCNPEVVVEASSFIEQLGVFEATGNVWSGLYRRSICQIVGPWNELLKRWQDLDYQMRLTCLAPPSRYVDVALVSMGNHGDKRIQSLQHQMDGIEGGLVSLRYMEKTLDAFQVPKRTVARKSVANFYLGTAKLAMQYEVGDAAQRALQGARRNRSDRRFLLQLALLEFIGRSFGGHVASKALEIYSRLRGGVQ